MGAAIAIEDVVRVWENRLVVGVAPLHRDLHIHAVFDRVKVDDVVVERSLFLVERLDELANPALELVDDFLALAALVLE